MSGVWISWWLDRNRVHYDVGSHIIGPVLCYSVPSESSHKNHQTKGQDMDRTDMDLRVFVLHRTGTRFGVQSVRV